MSYLPKIEGATLLSVEEATALLTEEERAYDEWWWLRSPGIYRYDATYVHNNGSVDYDGDSVCDADGYVRPALKINLISSNFKIGDTFSFGEKKFKIISDSLAFCLEDIGTHCFRKYWEADDANDYEASDVKEFVDAWFESVMENYKCKDNSTNSDYTYLTLTAIEKEAYKKGWRDGYREGLKDKSIEPTKVF